MHGLKFLVLLLMLLPARQVEAQFWPQVQVQVPFDATTTARFGWSLSLQGELLLVGAPGDDGSGPNSGAAYLYQRNNGGMDQWGLLLRLEPPLAVNNAQFGWRVLLSDDLAFVCAPGEVVDGIPCGAVHVYERDLGGPDNWGYRERIGPLSLSNGMRFGSAIAYGEGALVVGYDEPDAQGSIEDRGGIMSYLLPVGGPSEPIARFRYTTDPTVLAIHAGALYFMKNDVAHVPIDSVITTPADTSLVENVVPMEGYQVVNPYAPPDTNVWWDTVFVRARAPIAIGDGLLAGRALAEGDPDERLLALGITVTDPLSPALIGTRFQEEEISSTAGFGHAMAWLPQGRLVLSAPGPLVGVPPGQVRIYSPPDILPGTYALEQVLYQSDPALGDRFGEAIQADGDLLAVGAPFAGDGDRGKVYLFRDPTTGLTSFPAAQALVRVQPNPSTDGRFLIQPGGPSSAGNWRVHDATGRSVGAVQLLDEPILFALPTQAPGMYFLCPPNGGPGAIKLLVRP